MSRAFCRVRCVEEGMSLWREASDQCYRRTGVAVSAAFVCDARMDQFIAAHADKLQGMRSGCDRVLFRGCRPLFSRHAMANFLERRGIYRRDVRPDPRPRQSWCSPGRFLGSRSMGIAR
jgi:hypothetical protein